MSNPTGPQDPYGGYGQQPPGGSAGDGYGAPPPPNYYGGGNAMPPSPPPPNYLVFAILTTVLCCLPLGVASIVFSTQVNSKWAQGDQAGAYDASRKAKTFAIWSAILGVVLGVIGAALAVTGALADLETTTTF